LGKDYKKNFVPLWSWRIKCILHLYSPVFLFLVSERRSGSKGERRNNRNKYCWIGGIKNARLNNESLEDTEIEQSMGEEIGGM